MTDYTYPNMLVDELHKHALQQREWMSPFPSAVREKMMNEYFDALIEYKVVNPVVVEAVRSRVIL